MKKILSIVAVLVFAASFVFATGFNAKTVKAKDNDTAIIRFDRTTHNFGNMTQGADVKTTFTYYNDGTKDLILTNVRPSCGCTTPNWSREPLAPGDSAIINVVFSSAGKSNAFHKSITVTSNSGTVNLTIRGNILTQPAEIKSPVRVDN